MFKNCRIEALIFPWQSTETCVIAEHPLSDHDTLPIIVDIAERSAANADRRYCANMLERALGCLEKNSNSDSDDAVERLAMPLEEALIGMEHRTARETADLLARAAALLFVPPPPPFRHVGVGVMPAG